MSFNVVCSFVEVLTRLCSLQKDTRDVAAAVPPPSQAAWPPPPTVCPAVPGTSWRAGACLSRRLPQTPLSVLRRYRSSRFQVATGWHQRRRDWERWGSWIVVVEGMESAVHFVDVFPQQSATRRHDQPRSNGRRSARQHGRISTVVRSVHSGPVDATQVSAVRHWRRFSVRTGQHQCGDRRATAHWVCRQQTEHQLRWVCTNRSIIHSID